MRHARLIEGTPSGTEWRWWAKALAVDDSYTNTTEN